MRESKRGQRSGCLRWLKSLASHNRKTTPEPPTAAHAMCAAAGLTADDVGRWAHLPGPQERDSPLVRLPQKSAEKKRCEPVQTQEYSGEARSYRFAIFLGGLLPIRADLARIAKSGRFLRILPPPAVSSYALTVPAVDTIDVSGETRPLARRRALAHSIRNAKQDAHQTHPVVIFFRKARVKQNMCPRTPSRPA